MFGKRGYCEKMLEKFARKTASKRAGQRERETMLSAINQLPFRHFKAELNFFHQYKVSFQLQQQPQQPNPKKPKVTLKMFWI